MNHVPESGIDAAVIFGMRHGGTDPTNFFNSLDAAVVAYRAGKVGSILVSGRGWIGNERSLSGKTESRVGFEYLRDQGIPATEEPDSTSSVDNFLNVKRGHVLPNGWSQLWVPIAGYTIPRRKFIAQKIMGAACKVTFTPVECPEAEVYPDEEKSLEMHRELLGPMPDGEHDWLLENGQSKWPAMVDAYLHEHEPWLFEK